MTRTLVDYTLLEKEFVTGKESLRSLAKRYNVSWSTVADQSRKRDWVAKRAEHRALANERALEKSAERYADEAAEMRGEALTVMRATIRRYAEQLRDNSVRVGVKEAAIAITNILLLTGEATERTEARVIEYSTAGIDAEFLRGLEELARERLADSEFTEDEMGRATSVDAEEEGS